MATKGIDLDELQAEAEKLVALLENRELGLSTWHEFLRKRLITLHLFIHDVCSITENSRGDQG